MQPLKKRNSHIAILLMLLVLATGAMTALRSCRNNRHTTLLGTPAGDTINVALQYSPISFYMHDDTLGGLDYDLLHIIAKEHNLPLRYTPITTAGEGLAGLRSGRFDIVAANLPMTSTLRDSFAVTEPVYSDRQVLIQLNDSTSHRTLIESALGLRGDSVYVTENSPNVERLKNLIREIGDTIYICQVPKTAEQLLIMTALGEIPLAVINEQIARSMAEDYPQIDYSTGISFTQFQPWVLQKRETSLCDSLNVWLSAIKKTEKYRSLTDRYLSY